MEGHSRFFYHPGPIEEARFLTCQPGGMQVAPPSSVEVPRLGAASAECNSASSWKSAGDLLTCTRVYLQPGVPLSYTACWRPVVARPRDRVSCALMGNTESCRETTRTAAGLRARRR